MPFRTTSAVELADCPDKPFAPSSMSIKQNLSITSSGMIEVERGVDLHPVVARLFQDGAVALSGFEDATIDLLRYGHR